MIARPSHKPDHHTIGIDEAVSSAKAATDDIVATKLRKHAANVVAANEAHVFQSQANLLLVIRTQVGEVFLVCSAKKIALRTIVAGMTNPFLETRIKRNRVERHLDVD